MEWESGSITAMEAFDRISAGSCVITVNRRLSREIHRCYRNHQTAQGLSVWPGADVLPWEAWSRRCWEEAVDTAAMSARTPPAEGAARPGKDAGASFPAGIPHLISGQQALLVWEACIASSREGRGLPEISRVAQGVQEAHQWLQAWRLSLPDAEAQSTAETRAFARWAAAYEARCGECGWCDDARWAVQLAQVFQGGRLAPPPELILAGLEDPTPVQAHLFGILSAAGTRFHVLDSPAHDGQPQRVALPDAEAEAHTAARWARGCLEQDPGIQIGIVVPDLTGQRGLYERVFADVLNPGALLPDGGGEAPVFNISHGLPLSDYAPVDAALGLLALSPRTQTWERVGLVLNTPFLPGGDGERGARARLEFRLREQGGGGLSPAGLLAAANRQSGDDGGPGGVPELVASLSRWREAFGNLPSRQSPSGWAGSWSGLLQALGWPGTRPVSSAEFQVLQAWTELLRAFSGLDPFTRPLGQGEAVSLLARLAGERVFQPQGTEAPVQILGQLEATGLSFDRLWVAGLDDEVWPPSPRPNPYLPLEMQRRHGLPRSSVTRELEVARLATRKLAAAAPEVIFSHALSREDRPLRPSPLIAGLPAMEPGAVTLSGAPHFRDLIAASTELEPWTDQAGPPLPPGVAVTGGTGLFADQAACPFRAFAKHRLHARVPPLPEEGLDAAERGTLVHRGMEKAWQRIGDHATLSALEPESLRRIVSGAAGEAVAEFLERRPERLGEKLAALEQERLGGLLLDWMALEMQRSPFEVVGREREITFEIGGISVRGRMDRIDRLPNGRELVLDYKTGQVKKGAWDGERPDDPQLPLYCVSGEVELGGVAYAAVSRGESRFLGLADDPGVFPRALPFEQIAQAQGLPGEGRQAVLENWRRVLTALGEAYRHGEARVDPKHGGETCNYCGLEAFCRIAEMASGPLEQEEDSHG